MTATITASDLGELLAANDIAAVKAAIMELHPADLAERLHDLELPDIWRVLDLLPLERQAEAFPYFPHDVQIELAQLAPRPRFTAIVTEMNADDRADLFRELSDEQKEALLPALAHAEREDLRRLSSYAEGTAGSIMTSDYAVLSAGLTAAQALEALRREAPDKETIYRAYVTDSSRKLIGSLRLQNLILAPARALVGDIMERNTLAVQVADKQEFVARQIAKYDVLALPVVDHEHRLVGIVTHDDAADVLQEEVTEDFHKGGTVTKLVTNVRDASIFMLYRARIVWLVVLVFGNIFSGAGIAAFQDTIAAHVALLFFLPLLIASGGNAGAQAATLMVRALATGDVRMSDWASMIGREVMVAGLLGVSMAVAVSMIGLLRGGPEIALVVSASMVLIVLVGSTIGLSLPFLLTRLKLDPASASAPLVTSIADTAGVLIYFAIATAFLPLPAAG